MAAYIGYKPPADAIGTGGTGSGNLEELAALMGGQPGFIVNKDG